MRRRKTDQARPDATVGMPSRSVKLLPCFMHTRLRMSQDCGSGHPHYFDGMSRLMWLPLVAIACNGLTAGCTRTSDGSVVLARPASLARVFQRESPQPSYGPAFRQLPSGPPPVAPAPPPQVAASAPPPGAAARTQRRGVNVQGWRPAVKPPFARADPSRPLSCRNETSAGGRVRVVCN